jgi:hypothetical protein
MQLDYSVDYAGQPDYTLEQTRNKIRLELQYPKMDKEIKVSKKIKCSWCGEKVIDVYYKCAQHKTIFCYDCARNDNQKVIKRSEAPKCKVAKAIDCIYNKYEVDDAE